MVGILKENLFRLPQIHDKEEMTIFCGEIAKVWLDKTSTVILYTFKDNDYMKITFVEQNNKFNK